GRVADGRSGAAAGARARAGSRRRTRRARRGIRHGPLTTLVTEREFAIGVVRRLQDAGHQALWAGGCVRDELLGLAPKDYDVATDARPEQVQQLFRRTVAVGASFGVIEVLVPG